MNETKRTAKPKRPRDKAKTPSPHILTEESNGREHDEPISLAEEIAEEIEGGLLFRDDTHDGKEHRLVGDGGEILRIIVRLVHPASNRVLIRPEPAREPVVDDDDAR